MGSEDLAAAVLAELGVSWHGTTRDGELTIEPVYCLRAAQGRTLAHGLRADLRPSTDLMCKWGEKHMRRSKGG
jgi:hypothetical protein